MNKKKNNIKKILVFLVYTILVITAVAFANKNMNDQGWIIFQTISTISGILCVFLVAKKDIRNYYIGVIAVVTYGAVALHAGYVYDYLLNIYFLVPVQIIGLYMWNQHKDNKKDNEVVTAPFKHKWLVGITSLIAILLISTVFYDSVSVALKGNPSTMPYLFRFLDASTTVLTIVAQILMILRYKEQWILWIVVNVFSLIMWIYLGYPITIVMWVVYLINSIYGYIVWNKNNK